MNSIFDQRSLIDRGTLKQLMQRSDRPSLFKLLFHFALFVGCIVVFATVQLPWLAFVPMLLFFGFITFSLYAPFHECTHETAFSTPWLNTFGAWITGVPYGYSPGMHKGFHFTHHKLTNMEGDPEKGFSLPPMPGRIFLQVLVAGFLGMLVPLHSCILAVLPARFWDKAEASWAPSKERRRLAWECRFVALFWIAGIYFLAQDTYLLLTMLAAIFIGRFIHAFITVSEHEGLPEDGHQMHRTRTVLTNPVFRWFWWNMNYHSEHHTWPGVPWHQLPKAHELSVGPQMNTELSYVSFFARGNLSDGQAIQAANDTEVEADPQRSPA